MKNTIAKIAAIALVIMMTVGFVAEATTVTTTEVTSEQPVAEQVNVEETTEEPVAEDPAAIDYSALKVEIDSNLDEVVMEGEEIRLTSTLTGFEGLTCSLQWQYNDGDGWKNVDGAAEGAHTFIATEETLGYEWRLMATL